VTASLVDYRILRNLAVPMLAAAVILLLLVLVCGLKIGGARRWLSVGHGIVRFQPSEFAKIALIVAIAWYGERYQRQMGGWKRGMIIPSVCIGLVLGLIFVEPDRGATILLAAVAGMMLLIAGLPWKFVFPPVLAGVAGLGVSLLHDPMRINRIFAWLHPDDHENGAGYQVKQSLLALGTGGWTGLGLGNSREKLGFLPEHHTDFIFPIIGEELGLIATLLVVLGFMMVLTSGVYISANAGDSFGMLLGSGVTLLIGLQAFINIGVVTGTLPNKGLPLPFISYGGSNLLMLLFGVGLLVSIARHARMGSVRATQAIEAEDNPPA
jgi:cell division protein FtsW